MPQRSNIIRTYSELILLPTFKERFEYLKLDGVVGEDTFGYDRYMNQRFYHSQEWQRIRDFVIIRDNGCDLGVDGYYIRGKIFIHHLNPITQLDIMRHSAMALDPEFMVCASAETHNGIHFGDANQLQKDPIIRRPNDTCPWRV